MSGGAKSLPLANGVAGGYAEDLVRSLGSYVNHSADELAEIQAGKTVIRRQVNDNLYLSNTPQRVKKIAHILIVSDAYCTTPNEWRQGVQDTLTDGAQLACVKP